MAKYNPVTMSWNPILSAGGTTNDFGQNIAVDGSGNVYVAGTYSGTATFTGIINISTTSVGNNDIFVAKYNSMGYLQWVQSGGGTNYDYLQGIDVDANGNVYITGYFYGTATFGGISKTAQSQGYTDIFVAHYNSNGTIKWVLTAGGIFGEVSNDIAVDNRGNCYITGAYGQTATFCKFL